MPESWIRLQEKAKKEQIITPFFSAIGLGISTLYATNRNKVDKCRPYANPTNNDSYIDPISTPHNTP
ncbi:hypothetical protein AKJ18_06920 [Vibrio xuii]|nr:hypothetical protein AKJ18_06920 [Vibrio xuii]